MPNVFFGRSMVLTSQNALNLLETKASFPQIIAWDQALQWRKKEKKIGVGKKKTSAREASREVVWGGEMGSLKWEGLLDEKPN